MNSPRFLVLCAMLASFLVAANAQAKLYFLPDWQVSMSSRTETAPDKSGDLIGGTCEQTYGLSSSCPAPQIIKKSHNIGKIICYECQCPSSYQYTSCNTGYVLAGGACNGKYLRCDAAACPAGYTAGLTCGTGFNREVNGKSGTADCAKCTVKACASGYTAGLANCNGQSQPSGWTHSSNGYSGNSICGKCTAKTCASGFTAGVANCNGQSQPSGWTHSSNGYSGNSICGKCTAKTCPSGYTAGVSQCSNTTSWSYGSNGYAGNSICGKCTAKACDTGYTAGLSNCNGKTYPTGWTHSTGTASGSTVCGKCTAKSCAAGSTSCNSSTQNATANGYYAGDAICYTCTNKTCEQMGQKTCNGSCIATTACCGGCPTGQSCQNGTCVSNKTPLEICQDKILENDPKAAFISTAGQLVDAITAGKNAYLMNDLKGSTTSFTKVMAVRDLTYYAISECSGQPARKLTLTSPTVTAAVDFDVDTTITGTLSLGADADFNKHVSAKAITTTRKAADLYVYGCNSTIGQYTNNYNSNVIELVGNNTKNCPITVDYITVENNGVTTLQVTNCTLINTGGLIDNSMYSGAVSVYLVSAVWQLDNRAYSGICFSYAKPSWNVEIRQSCLKSFNGNFYNCANGASLRTLQYQNDFYWDGDCTQYCMSGGGFEDACISGSGDLKTYNSYPY